VYWLVDHANIWYVLLGIIAVGWIAVWWTNRRPKQLLGAGAAIALIVLVWLSTRVVITDRMQLDRNVHAMADAAVDGKRETLLGLFAKDFQFQGHKAPELAELITKNAKQHQVYDIHISSFEVEELTDRTAKVYFRASVHSRQDDVPHLVACRGVFVRENDQWKLREARFYNPVVDQNLEITLPLN
jgi:hypothetical protein